MPVDTIATVASPTKQAMAENNSFTCSVNPFCLGKCSWINCPENTDMAIREPHPQCQLDADQPHPTGSGCFALASEAELAKLAEGLIPPNDNELGFEQLSTMDVQQESV